MGTTARKTNGQGAFGAVTHTIDWMKNHEALLVFLMGVILFLPSIWSEASITGKDEYLLSFRTPMEMLDRGSWLTPWLDGAPRLKKPPLLYWSILAGYDLFGINLFGARASSVLFGAGLAASASLLYRRLFAKSGLMAGLLALGAMGLATQARMALLDLPLALFTTLAVIFVIDWGRSGHLKWMVLSGLALGLAFLSKGPVCFLFFGAGVVSALFVFGKWGHVLARWPHLLAGLLATLAVSLPWPLLMHHLWPNFTETVGHEMGGARKIGSLSYFFSALGGALGLIFPWTPVLFPSIVQTARDRLGFGRKPFWLALWFILSTLPFFFMMSFERYLLPTLPATCVLCAWWIEDVRPRWRGLFIRLSVCLMALLTVCFALAAIYFHLGIAWAGVCLLLAALAVRISFFEGHERLCALVLAILVSASLGGLYPELGINRLPDGVENLVGSSSVAVFNSEQPSMLSIRIGRSVIGLSTDEPRKVGQFNGLVFMKDDDAPAFEATAKAFGATVEREGQFRVFYSEKTWLRFARKGATESDFETALKTRSLEGLKTVIDVYSIRPAGSPAEGGRSGQ
ncbi:MAG: ArnT family glycosyltransferase [Acidobacteriota bacterium]